MRGLVQSLGPDCELALHHFRDVSSSLVNIEGPVTGRSQGAPLADLVPRILHQGDDPPDLVNCQPQTSEGRLLLFSSLFIRDDHGSVPGCLCLDRDMARRIVACNLRKSSVERTLWITQSLEVKKLSSVTWRTFCTAQSTKF
jgi:predicted transcriptional regulator YheO